MKLNVLYTREYLDKTRDRPNEFRALNVAKEALCEHYRTVNNLNTSKTTWIKFVNGDEVLVVGPADHEASFADNFDRTYEVNESVMRALVPLLIYINYQVAGVLSCLAESVHRHVWCGNPPTDV